MNLLKVGVIGAKGIGKVHARLWEKIPGVKLVGIVDINPLYAGELAALHKVPAFTSIKEFKEKTGADVLNVCVPSGLHVQVALEALRRGLHVFMEKPIDIKVDRALRLLKAARKAGRRLAVGSQKRWEKGTLQIQHWIKAGKLGKIFLTRAIVPWYRSQRYYDTGGWRGTYKMDGGGSLINQSIHMVDLMLYLTGKKAVSASAASGAFTHKIEAEDTLVGFLRMDDGTLGEVMACTSIYPGFAERVELYGEKGCVIWEGGQVIYSLFKAKKVPDFGLSLNTNQLGFSQKSPDPFEVSFLAQLKDAAKFFKTGKGKIVTGQSGTQTLAVIEALYKSSRTRQEEKVRQIKSF